MSDRCFFQSNCNAVLRIVVTFCVYMTATVVAPEVNAGLMAQRGAVQLPVSEIFSISPTLSLGQRTRSAKLDLDEPGTKYQNGFFLSAEYDGLVRVWNKGRHIAGEFVVKPPEAQKILTVLDGAVAKDELS